MRVFLYESITGGGLVDQPLPVSLLQEGERMAAALLEDLQALPGVEVIVTRDARLPAPAGQAEILWVRDAESQHASFAQACRAADAVWPIAPETGGELERVADAVLQAGRRLLASPPLGLRVAASKWATVQRLVAHGIAALPTQRASSEWAPDSGFWVLKPDDGVGGLGCRLVEGRQLSALLAGLPDLNRQVLQPYMPGKPASLSFICHAGTAQLLSVNRQHIAQLDGGFRLLACDVNALSDDEGHYAALADAIAAAMPELWGYVGADFLITEEGPQVLEVNPRLTTSYAGLRRATGVNPAGLVLHLAEHGIFALPQAARSDTVRIELEHARAH